MEGSVADFDAKMASLGEPREHALGLVHGERGRKRRLHGRDASAGPAKRYEEQLLPAGPRFGSARMPASQLPDASIKKERGGSEKDEAP